MKIGVESRVLITFYSTHIRMNVTVGTRSTLVFG